MGSLCQGRVELAPAGQRRHAQVVLGQVFGQQFAHRGIVVERDDVRLPMRDGFHDNASIDEIRRC